jgi:hypothetical protein
MRRRISAVVIALLAGLSFATQARALFHFEVIDEVMTSYNGDPSVQFIEMRMLAASQNFVAHSVFAAFDNTGTFIADILVVPANVSKSGNGTRWLIGTAAFQTKTGLAPDFVMPAGVLPTGGGMVCFGGGGGIAPQNPPTWSRTSFANYVDCVAYGTFAGPSNILIGTPIKLNADGHGLQRMGNTMDNAADFTCADPATPQNNAGATVSLAATDPCGGSAATATPTSTPPAPTMTPVPPSPTTTAQSTMTPTSITSPAPTATTGPTHPCTGDCNGDGHVNVNELIVAVNIALGSAEPGACPAFGGAKTVTITDLIKAVNDALNGCPATATAS